jgi:hypothetical protein
LLAAGLYYAYQNWGWFRSGVDSAVDTLQFLGRGFQEIIGWIKTAIGWIQAFIDALDSIPSVTNNPLTNTGVVGLAGGKVGRTIPKMAEGGILTGPSFVYAGEAGPEAVIPLDRLGNLGGGGPTVVINTAGVISERQLIDIVNEGVRKGYRLQDRGRGL